MWLSGSILLTNMHWRSCLMQSYSTIVSSSSLLNLDIHLSFLAKKTLNVVVVMICCPEELTVLVHRTSFPSMTLSDVPYGTIVLLASFSSRSYDKSISAMRLQTVLALEIVLLKTLCFWNRMFPLPRPSSYWFTSTNDMIERTPEVIFLQMLLMLATSQTVIPPDMNIGAREAAARAALSFDPPPSNAEIAWLTVSSAAISSLNLLIFDV